MTVIKNCGLLLISLLYTCHVISEADGAESDEAVVDGLGVGPALVLLEDNHGHDKEENNSTEVRHKVDTKACKPLQREEGQK